MKNLIDILKESSEQYQMYHDEDTGEDYMISVPDNSKQVIQAVKRATPEQVKKCQKLRKTYDDLFYQWSKAKSDTDKYAEELARLNKQWHSLQTDMEDALGHVEIDTDAADEITAEYSDEIDKVLSNIQTVRDNFKKATQTQSALNNKIEKAIVALQKYEEEIGYISK